MYAPAMAARLVGLDQGRVRRWLRGYEYTYAPKASLPKRRKQSPLVARGGAADSRYASFLDLIDLLFVRQFVEHGISVQKLRQALNEAGTLIGDHHFARRTFWTEGRNIYLQVKEKPAEALLQLLSNGQWVIAPVIKQIAHQIDFEEATGISSRWYPMGKETPVVVDPRLGFGAPAIAGRGIQTANVFDLYRGEEGSIDRVAEWLDLAKDDVRAAVRFEEKLAAA